MYGDLDALNVRLYEKYVVQQRELAIYMKRNVL
jgi:hypothetical protein